MVNPACGGGFLTLYPVEKASFSINRFNDGEMTGMVQNSTIDDAEIGRFAAMADEWWDPDGKFRPLHQLNPVRLGWIRDQLCERFDRDPRKIRPLEGLAILDIGCGGGLVAEPLARMGADVTGIDAAEKNVRIAETHAQAGNVPLTYRHATAEELAAEKKSFDAVMALEIVEHVADVDLFLQSCCALTSKSGLLILSTLNRTPRAWLFAIAGAEYVMRWLPVGTHQWRKFLRPSEMSDGLRKHGGKVTAMTGLIYNPLSDEWRTGRDVAVNYMMRAEIS